MKRLLLSAVLLLASTGFALAGDLPVSLKPSATIEGDTVKLGDLWDNLGDKAETVIAPSPQPGKRISADARWLSAVAQNYGINWQPANMFERITIERAGQQVDMKLVESELREALGMEGVPAPFEMEIANRASMSMVIPASTGPVGIAVRDVVWDARTSRFSATVEAPAGAPNAVRQRINGRVFSVSRIPVLNHTLGRGDVITERDVEWVEARAEAVRRDIITDPRQMIGQEPRFQVRQGAPVRLSDLQRPVLVARNATVTIQLKTPFMSLTTQGRASEEGGKGDLVHVTNLQSKRVVEAVIEGPNLVTVTSHGALALAN
ncbi:MAG TPA: flagellar basal body P-ring formation chaperone FlgA [Magnetospirillum sp.]|jgi:flagella basal body P-ring formation protein FlgA|nr:flagellar basal body P-ring formation chaperone FlgA [Magnetospirillum sp.]